MTPIKMMLTGLRLASPIDGPVENRYYALDFMQDEQPAAGIPRNTITLYAADVSDAEIGTVYDMTFAPAAPPVVTKSKTPA